MLENLGMIKDIYVIINGEKCSLNAISIDKVDNKIYEFECLPDSTVSIYLYENYQGVQQDLDFLIEGQKDFYFKSKILGFDLEYEDAFTLTKTYITLELNEAEEVKQIYTLKELLDLGYSIREANDYFKGLESEA